MEIHQIHCIFIQLLTDTESSVCTNEEILFLDDIDKENSNILFLLEVIGNLGDGSHIH